MPNTPQRDKKIRRRRGWRLGRGGPGADSVKSVLGRGSPVLGSIADQAARQRYWRQWLSERLPGALCDRVTGVVETSAELVIFTESAGWGVRLRYALADLDTELRRTHPAIASVAVRVLPGGVRAQRP